MPNVRLRTIINQDNSTTFQVQFSEGGEWTDLTWDMISDKPFETLDDTVFIVDENGVLTITNIPTVCSWGDVSDKPFIFLDPDDFSVDAQGKLSYTGSLDWTDITGKPFSTLDNNDFVVQNGKLSVVHQTIPNQTWSQIQNKPFTSLDPTNFQVVGGVLYLNLNPEIPSWSNVQNKPFTYLDNSDFAVVGDTLKVKHQIIPDPEWTDVQNKPFTSLDANDFSVDGNGKMSVNFPTPIPDDWDDITNKPFESLNSADFTVDGNGEASVNFPTPTPDDWDDITNKPFETLNSSDFSVDPDTGELSVAGGGTPDWSDILNKPFNSIGGILYTDNGVLKSAQNGFYNVNMSSSRKITSLTELTDYVKTLCVNTVETMLELVEPKSGWFVPVDWDAGTVSFMVIKMLIDNTQADLTSYSDSQRITIRMACKKLWQYETYDTFFFFLNIDGLPDPSDSSNLLRMEGCIMVDGNKTDGQYTGASYRGSYVNTSDVKEYYFS